MKIITNINQYTIDRLVAENKSRTEREVFPAGSITVPVFFDNPIPDPNSHFSVIDGKVAIRGKQAIDFGFRLYSDVDGPNIIPSMVKEFNGFIDSFRINRMHIIDNGIFLCIDKILFDLGYLGKMVKAEGIDKNENGNVSVFSINYAETLITTDSFEYEEYERSRLTSSYNLPHSPNKHTHSIPRA